MRAKTVTLMAAMATLGAVAPPAGGIARPEVRADGDFGSALSVLTYNVKGLPWPVTRSRSADLAAIGDRLSGLRQAGRQPHIVALQEAFTDEAKAIGARGGYAYTAVGPASEARQARSLDDPHRSSDASPDWMSGETEGHWVDSGLMLLSDYPILGIQRAAFPAGACGGFDCLANKGVLLVTIAVPGFQGPVDVLDTHLNSRHASGVSDARSLHAYQQQIAFLRSFIMSRHDPNRPLILAGDFNVGAAPGRRQALFLAIAGSSGHPNLPPLHTAMTEALPKSRLSRQGWADARWTLRRARDWQFYTGGADALSASAISLTFGTDDQGRTLSDHMGFTIYYRRGASMRLRRP